MSNKTQKVESFASVSSSIMMKIPTANLSSLRQRFMDGPNGLALPDFLVAVISHMDIADVNEMMLTVADLIDFFHFVDINGDGFMEWEEFVMFVLDSVVQDSKKKKNEVFQHALTRQVQSAAVRNPIISSVVVPALGKYLMGVGHEIQMYAPEEKSPPAHCTLAYTFRLMGAERSASQCLPGEKMLSVLDIAYLQTRDVLCVLRSDQHLEFFKFLSRTNYSSETVENLGKVALSQPAHRICWRSLDNRPDRLMAIGTHNDIHHWLFVPSGDRGTAELKDQKSMEKHTDYVRALTTVNTYFAKYVISASLDKTVVLWDLASLEYRSVRTGHTAGVESLAFGGKNMLCAGGYDYSIIVWDLEAAIDRPLFHLHGHGSCVLQIVAMESIERCASLDDEGNIFWWDISKNTPGATSTNRFIDKYAAPEDRARTFDVFTNLPYNYMTLHGVLFMTGGRRQHVFKLKDCTKQESAPVCTLYSQELLSVYTIHTHDVIFWSAVNAYQHKQVNGLVGKHSRISCGILDDRRRRMILGDSNGVVRFFNCLNGVCLKAYPPFVSPVKALIYSSDKNVLVLLDNSDIAIIDDGVEVAADSDYVLREVRIPVGGISGDLVCMTFSQRLGLLITVDVLGLLVVWDYAYLTPLWMLTNASGNDSEIGRMEFIGDFPLLLLVDNSKNFTILSFETLASNRRVEIWRLETQLSTLIPKEEQEHTEESDEDDEEGDSGARAKPFLYHKAAIFRKRHAEAKRMVIHIEQEEEEEEEEGGGDGGEGEMAANGSQSPPGQMLFPPRLVVRAICGYDDGTISITNITSALREIDIGVMRPEDYVSDQLGYNAKLKGSRQLSESDAKRMLSEEEIRSREKFHHATLEIVWRPHSASVVSLSIIGEYNWILTASEDSSIQVWDIEARFCGLLTRGSVLDKLFRNAWNNPEDMTLRSLKRIGIARQMIEELQLEHTAGARKNSTDSQSSTHSLQRVKKGEITKAARERITFQDPRDLVKLMEEETMVGLHGGGFPSLSSTDIYQSMAKIRNFPSRTRLLCQFDGHMTYDLSKKDIAKIQLRGATQLPSLLNKKKKKRRSKKKRDLTGDEGQGGAVDTTSKEDRKYLHTIQIADQCLKMATSKPPKREQLGKWHFESEMAAIEAQDPSNWDISSSNRFRDMYPQLFEVMMQRGVVSDRNRVIEAKISHLCPNGNLQDYLEYLRKSQGERRKAKQKRKTAHAAEHISSHVDMYTFEDGKVVAVSHDLQQVHSDDDLLRLEVLPDAGAKGGLLAGEESGDVTSASAPVPITPTVPPVAITALSNSCPVKASSTKSKPSLKQVAPPPIVTASTLNKSRSGVKERIDSRSRSPTPTHKDRKPLPVTSPVRPKCEQQVPFSADTLASKKHLETSFLPDQLDSDSTVCRSVSPGQKSDLILTKAEQSRQMTQELLEKFDKRMERSEILFRKADRSRKRKKTKLGSHTEIGTVETSLKGGDDAAALPRHKSFDEMLNMGKKHLRAESNWVRKVKMELRGSRQKLTKPNSVSAPVEGRAVHRPNRRETSIRLFQSMVENQKSEEERLRGRQYFGPYKSGELLQFFEVYVSLPKRQLDGTEVLLTATNKPEEADDTRDGTGGCVSLHDLLKHKYVRSRPHFKASLEKDLLSKVSAGASSGLFMTLQRILVQMCPLMTTKDRLDCITFFGISKSDLLVEESREVVYNAKQLKQLRRIFNYFDANNNGTVDREEIRLAVNRDAIRGMSGLDNLRGSDVAVETGVDEASIESMMDEGDEDNNNELDFDEFVKLFGSMYQ